MIHFPQQFRDLQFSIIDGMIDWVRVIDKEDTVFYANKKMKEDLGQDMVGKKCFEIFCQENNCDHCISRITLKNGSIQKKEAILNNKTYMVISSPMRDDNDEIIASVEVFRDITRERDLTKRINEKNKKMSDDIEFARNMQKRMLPPKGMYNGVNIDFIYESSELLSGDFFDVFKLGSDTTGIYICDVVGHGVTASLLTIFVRQSLRNITLGNNSLDRVMKELHKTFLSLNLDYDKYFSIFFGTFNRKTNVFQYINAGHNSIPILLRKSGELTVLEAKGYPISNIFDNVDYDVYNANLSAGDKLFFYTDGITEAKNETGEEYGVERLIKIINSKDNIMENLKISLDNYTKTQKDDYAFLMAEFI